MKSFYIGSRCFIGNKTLEDYDTLVPPVPSREEWDEWLLNPYVRRLRDFPTRAEDVEPFVQRVQRAQQGQAGSLNMFEDEEDEEDDWRLKRPRTPPREELKFHGWRKEPPAQPAPKAQAEQEESSGSVSPTVDRRTYIARRRMELKMLKQREQELERELQRVRDRIEEVREKLNI